MANINWSPTEIRDAIRSSPVSQAGIARDLGVSDGAVSLVIDGASSDRIRRHIARCLCRPVEDIWPEIYTKDGGLRRPGRPKTPGLFDQTAA